MDLRIKDKKQCEFELSGQHTDMIKCVQLSPEGMVCLSAGSDCTFKVWDLSTRRCIMTHGGEHGGIKKLSSYHRDTITTMDLSFDQDIAFTGDRDGSIFRSSIIDHKFSKIYQVDNPKQMVTCLKFDNINNKLWYGTASSTIKCLDLANIQAKENGYPTMH